MTSSQRPTVLLVEDDEDIRDVAREMLERRGFQVLMAGDAATAMITCRVHPGPIDVLLTDLGLPGVSGGELSRSVGPLRPSMGIVYMTGVPRDLAISRSLIKPGALLVSKPFTADALAGAVRVAMSGRNSHTP